MTGARADEDLTAGEAYGVTWVGSMWGWFDPEPGLRVTVRMDLDGRWGVACVQVSKTNVWFADTVAAAIAKAALADWGRT